MEKIKRPGTGETPDVKFFSTINDFFTFSTPQQHLALLDHWRQLASGDQFYEKENSPADLLYKYRHFLELYEAAYAVYLVPDLDMGQIKGTETARHEFLTKEAETLAFYPSHLDADLLARPLDAIKALFSKYDITFYREQLFEWLVDGLSDSHLQENAVHIVPLYRNTVQLIEACWLIRERGMSNEVVVTFAPLDKLVNFITAIIPVQYIFCLRHEQELVDLMIVLDQHCDKNFADLQPLLEFAAVGYPNITCTLHNYGVLNELLKNGMLYYAKACTENNCIYRKDSGLALPLLTETDALKFKQSVLPVFESGMKKARDFYQGAIYFLENYAYNMVPFMLQQACELTYRTLLLVMRGNDVKSHELSVLRKHIKRFVPDVIGVFSDRETEELRLLKTLEMAYVNSRYTIDHVVKREELVLLSDRTNQLQQKSLQIFNTYATPFKVDRSHKNALASGSRKDILDEWF